LTDQRHFRKVTVTNVIMLPVPSLSEYQFHIGTWSCQSLVWDWLLSFLILGGSWRFFSSATLLFVHNCYCRAA